jgi:tocopherol O-methyltransferase
MHETCYNDAQDIQRHYDVVSPYYESLWGEHIHHGYWIRGDETKEEAQSQLVEHLAETAKIERGSKILDVGCGIGGSSIYLAKKYQADVTGITISPVQVEMARKRAAREGLHTRFLLMNAESMEFDEPFDVIWSVESISHYRDPKNFFARAGKLLKTGGTLAITDWFKKENLAPAIHDKYIPPIEKSMMVELHTIQEYQAWMEESGLQVSKTEILNRQCAKTWDVCLDIINNKTFWKLAARNGAEFIGFLRGFKGMRAGFRSGNFIYAMMVAKRALRGS